MISGKTGFLPNAGIEQLSKRLIVETAEDNSPALHSETNYWRGSFLVSFETTNKYKSAVYNVIRISDHLVTTADQTWWWWCL